MCNAYSFSEVRRCVQRTSGVLLLTGASLALQSLTSGRWREMVNAWIARVLPMRVHSHSRECDVGRRFDVRHVQINGQVINCGALHFQQIVGVGET